MSADIILAEAGFQRLLELLRELDSVAVACSGGLDSSLLLAAARLALSDRVLALTVATPYMAAQEIVQVWELTLTLDVRHRVLKLPMPAEIVRNPPDRCYRCKRVLFAELKAVATEEGFTWLVDGSNRDDLADYRPGMRALRELEIRSPLLEADLGKTEIRRYARALNLPVWDKPASACLLTRLPHDTEVDLHLLERVEASEQALRGLGFRTVRVRCHGDLARIEVDRTDLPRLLDESVGGEVVAALTGCGFRYVTLDLQGYRMGSFNARPAE
jgi:uncharacterized protein